MKFLPVDLSSFKKIIEGDYIYVDKTRYIYDLYSKGGNYYFLARPRRFGKTLLLSTLKELFSANRELFKGLWIESSDYSWKPYPVILLNFSTLDSSSPELLKETLAHELDLRGKDFSIDLSHIKVPSAKLKTLLHELGAKSETVILIDEYDYPIISNLEDLKTMTENLKVIRDFFAVIKGLSDTIRAIFMTGVSQIPKASLASGMSILNDISLDPEASALLGYTKEEIKTYFPEYIVKLAAVKGISEEEVLNSMQYWYNGYRFSKSEERVYNPFSVHYLLAKDEFQNFWFKSGTPSFLVKLLKKNDYLLKDLERRPVSEMTLSTLSAEEPNLSPLLFQTGYLTISSYNEVTQDYILDYPNHEIRDSFALLILSVLTKKDEDEVKSLARRIATSLKENDMPALCLLLNSIFAHIPYQIDRMEEAHYHSMVHMCMMLLGFEANAEVSTNKGRIDIVVKTEKFIYIFELKVNTTAEVALKQIEERMYHEQFIADSLGRALFLVGLAFNKENSKTTVSCAHKKNFGSLS